MSLLVVAYFGYPPPPLSIEWWICTYVLMIKSQSSLFQKWSFFSFLMWNGPSMCPHVITFRVIQKVNVILKDNYELTFLAVLLHDVFLIHVQMKPLKTTSHPVGAFSRVQSPR